MFSRLPMRRLPMRRPLSRMLNLRNNECPMFNPCVSFSTKKGIDLSLRRAKRDVSLNRLDHSSRVEVFGVGTDMRNTTIVCTIGPPTGTKEKLYELIKNGMGIMRLNMSHGTHESQQEVIDNLRDIHSKNHFGRPIPTGVAIDLKGPEIRSGMLAEGDEVAISKDSIITITVDDAYKNKCSADLIYVDYEHLANDVKVGGTIFVDDGLLSLEVTSIAEDGMSVEVIACNDAVLSHKKGVNLPGVSLNLPSVTEQDTKDLKFAVDNDATMIFASFIRNAQNVRDIRKIMGKKGSYIAIISKIESQEGVENFDEILEESDGIMVARGDLGIEIPPDKVFLAQKAMIAKANILGKPIICATQMLDSMTYNPRPTRAEVSDVANAVIDGADCVMLSGETSKGLYPMECVQMMHNICLAAEGASRTTGLYEDIEDLQPTDLSVEENIALNSVSSAVQNQEISAIVVHSLFGTVTRLISKYRPRVPIIMITTNMKAARKALLYRGVFPYIADKPWDMVEDYKEYLEKTMQKTLKEVRKNGMIDRGDKIILVQGWSAGTGHTNTMRIVEYNEEE